jgi:hypothetical protein
MTRNQCYQLLDLRPGASEADIRRQYKRMALKLHPDINPDPKANEQFIQLTKAVEILLNPEPTPSQLRAAQRQSKTAETETEIRQRMEQARRRYEQQKAQRIYENARYFKQLTSGRRWLIFRSVMLTGWVIALALILDTALPTHFEKDELLAYSRINHNGLIYNEISEIELKQNGNYYVQNTRGNWIDSYHEVEIEKSWLLHTPVTMYTTDDYEIYETGFDFHIGAIRWMLVVLLMVPLFTYFRRKHDLLFAVLYQFSFWGIGGLVVYILLTENRLTHLLTLGFF